MKNIKAVKMSKTLLICIVLPLAFFLFILRIIFLADSADYNFAFKMVGHIPYGDKIAHVLLYGMMAFLLNFGLNFKCIRFFGFPLQLGAIIVLIFAVFEEFTQYYIPSRTFDLGDLLADVVGIILFSFLKKKNR